jgi:imidazolonepropionase-like amidohydrolase
LEGLRDSPRVLLPASTLVALDLMLRFGKELGKHFLLYGGQQAYEASELLGRHQASILMNLRWPEKGRDDDPEQEDSYRVLEFRSKAPSSPAALEKAGVRFAFFSGGMDDPQEVFKTVRRAIGYGSTRATALRAMTLATAELFGAEAWLGSLEAGKIANLTVTDGELFDEQTRVRYVFVDGVKYEPLAVATPAKGVEK